MVMRRSGHLKPRFFRAAWTRSPLSRTAESGRPTMERAGIPPETVGLDFHGEAVEALEAEALEDCVHGRSFLPDGAAETIHKRR